MIEYQREEISVLLEQNGGKPKAFTVKAGKGHGESSDSIEFVKKGRA